MADRDRYTEELEEINRLLEDAPEAQETPDLEDILTEFVASRRDAPSSSAHFDVPLDDSTLKMKALAEEMRKLSLHDAEDERGEAEASGEDTVVLPFTAGSAAPLSFSERPTEEIDLTPPLPPPEFFSPPLSPPDMQSYEEAFGPPEEFGRAFAPSDDFIPDLPAQEEDPSAPPRRPLSLFLSQFVRRWRRPPAPRPVMSVQEASARLGPRVRSLTFRCLIALALCLPLLYITFAPQWQWPLPDLLHYGHHPYAYLFFVGVSQVLVMLCAIDMLARGLQDLLRLRPGAESLLFVSCLCSLLHVFSLVAFEGWIGFLPYCACNAVGTAISLWGKRQQMEACRRSYQAVAVREPMMIYREDRLWEENDCYTKAEGTTDDFVERAEAPDLARRFASFIAPLTIVACVVAAVLSSAGQGRGAYFFWALSALTCASTPFVSLLVFSLPFVRLSRRLALSGAALPGWTAAREFTPGAMVTLTDTDLFPAGTISLDGLKVFGSYGFDRVVSCAAALVSASGSGLFRVFMELLQNDTSGLRRVDHFQHHEGGIGGEVSGDRVLLGGANFIISMGIHLPKEMNVRNALFVTINSDLAGIFGLSYIGAKNVSRALALLSRQRIPQILAVRDFNITDKLVSGRYKRTDEALLRYPTVEERLVLSEPARDPYTRPIAAVTREGLEPYAECVSGGIRLRRTARINLILYAVSAVLGLVLSFYFAAAGAASTLSPANVTLFLLLWCLPVSLISGLADRY